jgi:osmotically-inducible protein OsmY
MEEEGTVKHSEQLQLDVVDELAFDPAVDSSKIAVTASDAGVVTLKGSVPSYMQARQADRATKRVHGVKGVANDLEVKPADGYVLDDTHIAESALRAIAWSISVPKDTVRVEVTEGWITLDGKVDWDFQRRAAFNAVRDLRGVRGVSNMIQLTPAVKPAEIKGKIEGAFRRNAQLDAQRVSVEAVGGRVTLRGTVEAFAERDAAERAAFSAPGVTSVDNRIEVRSHALV